MSTVILDGFMEERKDTRGDVMAVKGQRPGSNVLGEPVAVFGIAVKDPVVVAVEALPPELTLDPSWGQPNPIQRPPRRNKHHRHNHSP